MKTNTYYPIYIRQLPDKKIEAKAVDFDIQPIIANDIPTAMLNVRMEIEKEIVNTLNQGNAFPYGTDVLNVPNKEGYQVLGFDLNIEKLLKFGTESGLSLDEVTIKFKVPKWMRDNLPKKNQDVRTAFFNFFIKEFNFQKEDNSNQNEKSNNHLKNK